MNKESLSKRIQELDQRRAQAKQVIEQFTREVFVLEGAIQENTIWLNAFHAEEKAAADAKAKEDAKKLKSKKKKPRAKPVDNVVSLDSAQQSA